MARHIKKLNYSQKKFVACHEGTMFLESIDTSSCVKDRNMISAMLVEVVEELGVKHGQGCKLCGSWKNDVINILLYFGSYVMPMT